jgi:hypothetical protein
VAKGQPVVLQVQVPFELSLKPSKAAQETPQPGGGGGADLCSGGGGEAEVPGTVDEHPGPGEVEQYVPQS